jgi:putative aldouronate transport system permease protein
MITRALGISVLVTVVGTVLGVMLTTSMGYVLSRPNYKLKGLLTWIVFIPMVFNGGLVSSYYINSNLLGLQDTVWALILPLAVSSFNVIICKTFFRSTIPDALIESAEIDGSSQLRIFFSIVLPISLPVLATIGLFLCFSYWNDWFQSMLYINNQSLYSLQALLNSLMTNVDALAKNASSMGISYAELVATMPKESARMAVAIVIVVPVAVAYPFFQKYFISGLTVGAVKG